MNTYSTHLTKAKVAQEKLNLHFSSAFFQRKCKTRRNDFFSMSFPFRFRFLELLRSCHRNARSRASGLGKSRVCNTARITRRWCGASTLFLGAFQFYSFNGSIQSKWLNFWPRSHFTKSSFAVLPVFRACSQRVITSQTEPDSSLVLTLFPSGSFICSMQALVVKARL